MKSENKNIEDEKRAAFLNGEQEANECSMNEIEDSFEVWQRAGDVYSFSKADADKAWDKMDKTLNNARFKDNRGKKVLLRILSYAAIVIFALGLGFWGYMASHKSVDNQLVLVSKQTALQPDAPSRIVLSDGSEIALNAGTFIEYPEIFGADERRIKLTGEAFFEITKDTDRPFIIEANGAVIEVLGTSFNVRAYSKGQKVEVNVKTGTVMLKSVLSGKEEILPAGNYGSVEKSTGETELINRLSPNYHSWFTREMNFDNTPLSEVFRVLENTYHVSLSSESSDINSLPTSIGFSKHDLDHVLTVIAKMHALGVNKTNDGYVFVRQ